jgi:hypothetical protein
VQATTYALQEYVWESVGANSTLNFLVRQIGSTIRFFDLSATPIGAGIKSFTVDLTSFQAPGAATPSASPVQMASGKGYLFIVGERIEPIFVEYNSGSDTITASKITIKIRDLFGLDDGLDNSLEPTTLSTEHRYNLQNHGWNPPSGKQTAVLTSDGTSDSSPIIQYHNNTSRYPGNNKQWWVARDATDNTFKPSQLALMYFGNTQAPRGHYILDAFNKDRSTASLAAGIPIETTTERPPTVAFFSGRVWYALNSNVYFSQILDDKAKVGLCYQEGDPTAENQNDLVATDGGVIPIPEMTKAVRLFPMGSGIVVLARNGVWYVTGTQNGFSATDISVTKMSPVGTDSPNSVVMADGNVFWWGQTGIQGLVLGQQQVGPLGSNLQKVNLSQETIQSFYNDISDTVKARVKSVYDPVNNVIQWLFQSSSSLNPYFYDRVLNLDLSLGAFFPWTISSAAGRPFMTGLFLTPIKEIKYTTAVPVAGPAWKFTFSEQWDETFADWKSFNGTGFAFMSFVETGYELLEDVMRKKQTPYVMCYFRRTEENFVGSGGNYTADKPSSCLFQVKWDWASSTAANKWSTKVEAYRHTRLPMFSEGDLTFDTGYPIVVTRNKVRGTGRAIQFRFENNQIGKDFDLLGWAVTYSGNTQP